MLHRLPESSEIFVPDVNGEATAFNAESARVQRAVGVNPRECLKLGILPGDARTELDELFSYLQLGIWISPAEGYWYDHDEELHRGRIRNLHPNTVKTIINAATIGEEQLLQGKVKSAERIGTNIDILIDENSSLMEYLKLIDACGVDISNLSAYPDNSVQEQHTIDFEQVA